MDRILTLEDLKALLVKTAGPDDQGALQGDIATRDFADLGYDSLALLELAAEIQRSHGISLSDEQVTELRTPGSVLDAVNAAAQQPQAS